MLKGEHDVFKRHIFKIIKVFLPVVVLIPNRRSRTSEELTTACTVQGSENLREFFIYIALAIQKHSRIILIGLKNDRNNMYTIWSEDGIDSALLKFWQIK
jgi:hypothetical protein